MSRCYSTLLHCWPRLITSPQLPAYMHVAVCCRQQLHHVHKCRTRHTMTCCCTAIRHLAPWLTCRALSCFCLLLYRFQSRWLWNSRVMPAGILTILSSLGRPACRGSMQDFGDVPHRMQERFSQHCTSCSRPLESISCSTKAQASSTCNIAQGFIQDM